MLRTSKGARKAAAQFHAAAAIHPNANRFPSGSINGNGFGRDGFPLGLNSNNNRNINGGLNSANGRNNQTSSSSSSSHPHPHPSNVRDTPTDDSSQTSSQDAPTIASSTTSLTSHNRQKNSNSNSSSNKSASNRNSTSSSNQRSNLSRQSNRQDSPNTPPPKGRSNQTQAERARIRNAAQKANTSSNKRRRSDPGTVRPSSDEEDGDDEDNPTNGRSAKFNGRGRRRYRDASESESEESDSQEEVTPAPKRARTVAPAWKRKVFLSTGLYSQEFKSNVTADSSSVSSSSTPMPERQKEVFPQPLHFGVNLLTDEQSFKLPEHYFDVAEDARAKLEAKKFKKPPSYTFIRTNQYTSRPKLPGEVPVCFCDPDDNCGDNCMNRLMQFICNPKHCPCGEKCTNGSLGKRPTAKLDVQHYGARGFGLKTLQPLKKDQFITEYRGEVINQDEAARRVAEYYHKTGRYYLLDYDAAAGEVLDAGLKGNMTRFANHSCSPNCFVERWLLCGTDEICTAEFQIGLFALRDIEVGEELTYDYGWSAFGPKQAAGELGENACHCGAPNCCGELGGKKVAGPVAPAPVPSRSTKAKGELSTSKKNATGRDRNGNRGSRQAPMVKGRVVKQRYKAAMAAKAAAPKKQPSSKTARPSSDEDDEDKPKRTPVKTAADSIFGGGTYSRNSFAPELPSVLASNGMSMRAARRVRNAWLARIRRLKKRGVDHSEAILEASRRDDSSATHRDRNEVLAAEKIVAGLNKQSTKSTFAHRKIKRGPRSKSGEASSSNSRPLPVAVSRPSVTPSPPPPSSRQTAGSLDKGKGKAKEVTATKKSIGAANFYSTSARTKAEAARRGSSNAASASASSDEEDSDGDVASDSVRKDWIRPSGARNSAKGSSSTTEESSSSSNRGPRRNIVTPSKDIPVPLRQRAGTIARSRWAPRLTSPLLVPVVDEKPLVLPRKKNNEAERLAYEASTSRLGGGAGVGASADASEESSSRTRGRRSAADALVSAPSPPVGRRMTQAERLAHEAATSKLSGNQRARDNTSTPSTIEGAEKRARPSLGTDTEEPASKKAKSGATLTSSSSSVKLNGSGAAPADEDDDEVFKQLSLAPEDRSPKSQNGPAAAKPRASAPAPVVAKEQSAASSKPTTSTSTTSKVGPSTPALKEKPKPKPRASAPGAIANGKPPSAPKAIPSGAEPSAPGKNKKFVYTDRVCAWCKTSETGVWRPGPSGPATLCNACGSKWRRHRIAEGLIPDPAAAKKVATTDTPPAPPQP